ncbi:MAG: hypothetical protein ABFD82_19325 [Syntrophaceae bacterium]
MKTNTMMFALFLLTLFASNGCAANDSNANEYQKQIDAIKELQKKSFVPRDRADIPKLRASLNVNDYFRTLKNISLEKGWKLDFIYWVDSLGSYPIIFAKKEGTEIDFLEKYKKDYRLRSEYLNHIKIDGTKDGFLQYVIMSMIGNQFALGWHANYHDAIITCTKDAVERVLKMRNDNFYRFDEYFMNNARKINPTPSVTFNGDQAVVRIVHYTSWGGFIELTYNITKSFPHKIIKTERKVLVPFECGINF